MSLPSSKKAANILAALAITAMLAVTLGGIDFRSIAKDVAVSSVAATR